jgi:hypothetical protein
MNDGLIALIVIVAVLVFVWWAGGKFPIDPTDLG